MFILIVSCVCIFICIVNLVYAVSKHVLDVWIVKATRILSFQTHFGLIQLVPAGGRVKAFCHIHIYIYI